MTYSDVLATLAFLISLVAVYRTIRWGRPKLKVTGDQWITSNTRGVRESAGFELSVVNIGDQTTEILDAKWELDKGDDLPLYISMTGPEKLPQKIERFGYQRFTAEIPLSSFTDPSVYHRARPVVSFTSRKSRQEFLGDWVDSQLRYLPKPE